MVRSRIAITSVLGVRQSDAHDASSAVCIPLRWVHSLPLLLDVQPALLSIARSERAQRCHHGVGIRCARVR